MSRVLDVYPFLHELPGNLLQEIDLHVLMIPEKEQLMQKNLLETSIQVHLVIYDPSYCMEGGRHLCRTLHTAVLRMKELQMINEFQNQLETGIVVAYEKPIRLR